MTQHDGLSVKAIEAALDALERHATDTHLLPAVFTGRERALLGYALALTEAPHRMTAAHLAPLRDAGLSDAEILDANAVTAYFAYVNRVVDGLGVELESPPPRRTDREPAQPE